MPGRGKKRARSSIAEAENDLRKKQRISHCSHPDLTKCGVVLACGEGDVGQLGLGEDVFEKSRPAKVDIAGEEIVSVTAGGMHTVCLTNKGEIYTFGCNDESALGRDTSVEGSETEPAKVDLPGRIIQISAGDSHTGVLTEDGKVFAFGNFRDSNGSIGLTVDGIQKTAVEMLPDIPVIKIASGGDHLVCLSQDGDVYTCGCGEQGQLGRVAECFSNRGGRKGLEYLLKPAPVRCMKHKSRKKAKFSDVFAGQFMTFAKEKETGDIYAWGLNNYHQLGFSDTINRFSPERVPSLSNDRDICQIDGGQHHAIALSVDGKVSTFGRGDYGRLGFGDDCKELKEPKDLDLPKCTAVAAGQAVSFVLTEEGDLMSFGMGTSKQLGSGDEEDISTPTKVTGKQLAERIVISMASGGQHTVILAKDKK